MSTRNTLLYQNDPEHGGDGECESFHLFTDVFDDKESEGDMYLEIENFCQPQVIAIPPRVWNRIIQLGKVEVPIGRRKRIKGNICHCCGQKRKKK